MESKDTAIRIRRISFYEQIFDELQAADPAEGIPEELEEKRRLLEQYYTSGEWLEDLEADDAGALPADLKRGVLSEDGVFDLLERLDDLKNERHVLSGRMEDGERIPGPGDLAGRD